MIKDAEAHAAEDRKKREVAEARNQLDTLIYTTEKSLKEFGDKIDSRERQNIEEAIQRAKKAMESNDLSTIKSAQDDLTRTSHKLAEAMYAKASQKGATTGGAQEGERKRAQEDVVDADFEDVKK